LNSSVLLKINKCYQPLLDDTNRYLLLYGGAGSGKSVFASQKMLLRLANEPGHRILVLRKVARKIKQSVFARLKAQIQQLELQEYFSINHSAESIVHLPTGNEIITAGVDDVEKLKSIETITAIWMEEATELSEADFDQLDLRLRGISPHYKQIILTFNPVDERHWIKKRFFDTPLPNATIHKTTFADNAFIDPEYRQVLHNKIAVSPNLYRIYYLGEWGCEEVESPYALNFNRERHISNQAVFNPGLPVSFSIDFNVQPLVCICAHNWIDDNGQHLHVFKELAIEKNADIHQMLDLITNTFNLKTLSHCDFTGDAMARKREITQRNNIDAWRIIDNRLRLGRRLMLPRANPSVRDNRHLLNAILAFHPDLKIHPTCTKLIYDMQYVQADEQGNIIKTNRANLQQRADALDTFRYLCNTHLYKFLDTYQPPVK
jgi:phage terminase large subunit